MSLLLFLLLLMGPTAHADSVFDKDYLSAFEFPKSSEICVSTQAWRSVPNTAFSSGEDLLFIIHWGVITGGYSTMSVREMEQVNGRSTYHLVSDAHSGGFVETFYKVRDRNDAWLDADSLTTVRYEKRIHEGNYRIEQKVHMNQPCCHYIDEAFRIDKNKYEVKQGSFSAYALDVLGSLYYVRTLPLEVGQVYSIDVYSGEKTWALNVTVKKKETVEVPAGKFKCLVVEPLLREPGIFVSKGNKLEVWLTDDERKMPVRMRSEVLIGHVSADLVDYHVRPKI